MLPLSSPIPFIHVLFYAWFITVLSKWPAPGLNVLPDFAIRSQFLLASQCCSVSTPILLGAHIQQGAETNFGPSAFWLSANVIASHTSTKPSGDEVRVYQTFVAAHSHLLRPIAFIYTPFHPFQAGADLFWGPCHLFGLPSFPMSCVFPLFILSYSPSLRFTPSAILKKTWPLSISRKNVLLRIHPHAMLPKAWVVNQQLKTVCICVLHFHSALKFHRLIIDDELSDPARPSSVILSTHCIWNLLLLNYLRVRDP